MLKAPVIQWFPRIFIGPLIEVHQDFLVAMLAILINDIPDLPHALCARLIFTSVGVGTMRHRDGAVVRDLSALELLEDCVLKVGVNELLHLGILCLQEISNLRLLFGKQRRILDNVFEVFGLDTPTMGFD